MKAKFKVTFTQIKVDDFSFPGFNQMKVIKKINNTPRFQIDFRNQVQNKFKDMINIDFNKVPKVIKDNKFIITVEVPNTELTTKDIEEVITDIKQIIVQTKVDRRNFGQAFLKTYIERF